MIWDREVGGSNPLAPTNNINNLPLPIGGRISFVANGLRSAFLKSIARLKTRLSISNSRFTEASARALAQFPLEPEFDPAVNYPSLGVCINLAEGRHLVRWENHLAKASLASICYVFEIDKKAVLPERLFAKDS